MIVILTFLNSFCFADVPGIMNCPPGMYATSGVDVLQNRIPDDEDISQDRSDIQNNWKHYLT